MHPAAMQYSQQVRVRVSPATQQRIRDAARAKMITESVWLRQCIDRALVEKAKKSQVSVWAWTADKPDDWARIVEAGVDGIITNVPHKLREWLGSL